MGNCEMQMDGWDDMSMNKMNERSEHEKGEPCKCIIACIYMYLHIFDM